MMTIGSLLNILWWCNNSGSQYARADPALEAQRPSVSMQRRCLFGAFMRRSKMRFVLVLLLVCSLMEVHSQQTIPYVSFMGQTLANHSYVDLSLVGDDLSGSDSVQCHTDLSTCCSGADGPHRGDWYFPDGYRLPFGGGDNITIEARYYQRVDLRRQNSATSPVGIYRCEIHTTDHISIRAIVYVGLYTDTGGKPEAAEIGLWFCGLFGHY